MPPLPTGFPVNITGLVRTRLEANMPDHAVVERPVRFEDPEQTLGIYCADWTPDPRSHQIGQEEPARATYIIRIQNMVKSYDEEYCKQMFGFDSKSVRVVLYRDPVLQVQLPLLIEEILGTREIVKKWRIGRQRFLNTELQSYFTSVAQTDFAVEVESIKL